MKGFLLILVIFGIVLFSENMPMKKQRGGGGRGKAVGVLILLLILGIVGGLVWYLTLDKSSPTPTPTPASTQKSGKIQTLQVTAPTPPVTPIPPAPPVYLKYDPSTKSWGPDKPCSPYSSWGGRAGINANTDTSVITSDGQVICQVPSADTNGQCEGDCHDECLNYYGQGSDDNNFYFCDARGDNICTVQQYNGQFKVYTDSNCTVSSPSPPPAS